MGHTPGPWEADCGGVCDAQGNDVAVCGEPAQWSGDSFHPFKNAEANARLIAAAPDLLEALRKAERQIVALYRAATPHGNYGANKEGSDLNQSAFADQDEAVIAARAAIARATGASV